MSPSAPCARTCRSLKGRLAESSSILVGQGGARYRGQPRASAPTSPSALALAGSHVYVSARHDDHERQALHDALRARGAQVEFIAGDAGRSRVVRARAGGHPGASRAAGPAGPERLCSADADPPGPGPAAAREQYVRDNLRLSDAPLSACAAALADAAGAVVLVSSSFVEATPAGFQSLRGGEAGR